MEHSGFIKYINQDFYESTGEKKVREIPTIVDFVKTAAFNDLHQEVRDFITGLKPREGYGYLLISAMSDENWGDNNNGDYFPEESLNNPTSDFGHKTFQRLAHWYRLHKNKDPKEAYGKVIFSYWNPQMHRVELIVEYDKEKDDWTSRALADNQDIETSMGTKVNYDICSICHPMWRQFYKIPENKMIELSKTKSLDKVYEIGKAYGIDLSYVKELNPEGGAKGISRNISSYCDHIKQHKREVMPNGQKVFMVNLRPVFFDISFVRIHADKSSYVLAKVASEIPTQPIECLGPDCVTLDDIEEYIKKEGEKGKISEDKEAEIEKRIKGQIIATDGEKVRQYLQNNILPALAQTEQVIPNQVLDSVASKNSLEEILSSFLGLGMFPRPREFQRIVLIIQGKKQEADEFDRDDIHITDEDSDKYYRAIPMGDTRMDIGPDRINDDILEQLLPFASMKSYFHKPICTRIIMIKKAFMQRPFGESPPQYRVKPVINAQMPSGETRSPLPAILAAVAAYLGLAKASGKSIKPIIQTMARHKGKILAAVIGAAVVSEIAQQADKEVQANKAFLVKHGGVKARIGKGLFLFPGIPAATYVAAEHFKQKAYRGRALSIPEKVVAKHPFATSIGAIMLAHKGSRKMIGSILKKLFKGGELMVKSGMDFEGLDLDDYPVQDHEKIIVGLWDALSKHGASLIDPNFKED